MKSTKYFNNISDKLKASIPKLKPGEAALFQMLNGVPNADPDERERGKNPVLYGRVQLQTHMRIYDPYIKDENGKEVGGYVDIGVVDAWNGDRPERFRCFVPGQGFNFQGKFELKGGSIQDEELYEVLYLSNQREGNPHRDQTVEALFKIVNTKADSEATITKVDILRKALDIAKNINTEDAMQVMAAMNKNEFTDPIVLKAEITKIAKDTPDDFIKAYESPDRLTKYNIKKALNLGILSHDIATGKLSIGENLLTEIKVENLDKLVPAIADWVKTAKNGEDVYNNITNQLEAKSKDKAKA